MDRIAIQVGLLDWIGLCLLPHYLVSLRTPRNHGDERPLILFLPSASPTSTFTSYRAKYPATLFTSHLPLESQPFGSSAGGGGRALKGTMAATNPPLAPSALLLLLLVLPHQVVGVKPIPQLRTESRILQDSIVEKINADPTAGWKASMNPRFSNVTIDQFRHMLGVKPLPLNALDDLPVKTHLKSLKLPKEFDARKAWPQCSTIGYILDQGHCGSCWAFGAVESLQDRFCIHFDMNISLSVNDLLSCCGFMCGDGCDGGYPIYAWRYLVQNGVVTEECNPYFDDIGCAHPGCEPLYPTPRCEKQCKVKNMVWEESKHFSVNAYRISSNPHDIMAEVYKNGPAEVAFTVYEDFAHYKSGVYKHITGDVMGGHAVKLIGWGTSDDGEDYWLLANQWNRGWGDDGYFKIIRGRNDCGIEEDVVAGLPSTKNLVRNYADMEIAGDATV